jgi:predicted nucleic acid-binding protein
MAQITPSTPRIFLDANILFSASLGGGSFDLLWELAASGQIELITSRHCWHEAEDNLEQKYPEGLGHLVERMDQVKLVAEAKTLAWMVGLLPEKDLPVLAAAVESKAAILLTGDIKHFGALMNRDDLPIRISTVRTFLLG